MNKQAPSIFNDVLGPVMRGPSSSHVAGAMRIASLLRMAMKEDIKKIYCDFDINGSLAESHDGHGSDMGFACGMNALASSNMRLAGFDKVIPLDETIQAMYDIGKSLPLELRCTFGGLGKTKTSMEIRERLDKLQFRK